MFVREYGLILAVSSLVAFAVGYLIMLGWLKQYLKRITIGPVFYLGIFVATTPAHRPLRGQPRLARCTRKPR